MPGHGGIAWKTTDLIETGRVDLLDTTVGNGVILPLPSEERIDNEALLCQAMDQLLVTGGKRTTSAHVNHPDHFSLLVLFLDLFMHDSVRVIDVGTWQEGLRGPILGDRLELVI